MERAADFWNGFGCVCNVIPSPKSLCSDNHFLRCGNSILPLLSLSFFFFLNFWFANNTKQPSEGSWDLSYFWFLDYFSHPLRVKILGKLEARTSNSFAFHGIHVQKWRGWLAKHNTKKHEDSKYIFKCSKILLIMTRNDFCFFFNGWRSKHCFYKSLHLRRCQH